MTAKHRRRRVLRLIKKRHPPEEMHIFHFLDRENAKMVIKAPSEKDAREIFHKILGYYPA